jgi:DNA invertase Pin-like site-specific DNA recombinase
MAQQAKILPKTTVCDKDGRSERRAADHVNEWLAKNVSRNQTSQNVYLRVFESMLIGYARVSTADQNSDLQIDALLKAGVDRRHIFEDRMSGLGADRPKLTDALAYLAEGDVLVVWKLDRLARSLPHLIEMVVGLDQRGIGFRSLTENIDTTTAGGRLTFHIFGALAQFERDIIRERTVAGIEAAAARGRRGGRPRAMGVAKIEAARHLPRRRHADQGCRRIAGGWDQHALSLWLGRPGGPAAGRIGNGSDIIPAGFAPIPNTPKVPAFQRSPPGCSGSGPWH